MPRRARYASCEQVLRRSARGKLEPDGYLPLTPAVLDIMVILGNEETHGYAITQEVRRRTKGQRRLVPGTPTARSSRCTSGGFWQSQRSVPSPASTASAGATIGLWSL